MIISPNATVVVYQCKQQRYYKSVHSRFEIMYPEYKMVGYIEDLGVLCCGYEIVYYDMNSYVNDIMTSDFQEMTYSEYVKYYQNKLEKENPGAPVLNDSPPITFGVPQTVTEYQAPEAPARQMLNSNINVAGVNVKILRG
ncbi:hypothetical protein DQT32_02860 [Salmonella enterica subsp. enterica serovar Braenderup]|nr:hypothetical protein [Salmonella enterica subsp. enterica serovar Braenderup]